MSVPKDYRLISIGSVGTLFIDAKNTLRSLTSWECRVFCGSLALNKFTAVIMSFATLSIGLNESLC